MPTSHRPQSRPGHRLRADRHRTGLRVRLLGHPGVPGVACRRAAGQPGELQPGDHHDRPRIRRQHLRRADHRRLHRENIRPASRARQQDRRGTGHPGRPDRAERRRRSARGWRARKVRRRDDRRRLRGHPARRGSAEVQGHRRQGRRRVREVRRLLHDGRGPRDGRRARPSGGCPALVHDGRARFRHGALGAGRGADGRRRPGRVTDGQRADRGIHLRLEGIRARADARPPRQRRGGLLDRELRPDGRAHRRFGDRRTRDDVDRPRISDDA